ncbi:hypothetical protein C6341_g16043 [Phytophthora cactorum]|nr:hypothetical protein C6341_g16043 [Phytophthora cactorum]
MDVDIPSTYKQARASKFWPQWRAAMIAEQASLKKHETWRLLPRKKAKGVKRFKARLVIHGLKQQFGINYTETYAPVIRFETIRAAIYFALQRGWEILQYDVKTAFLYGDLDELIFMDQPPGFQVDGPSAVCELLKSLYGLKQASNVWNRTLHAKLVTLGFERTDSDYGLYVLKENGEVKLLLTVYVDDLLLMGTRDLCAKIAAALQETFELTTMGTVKYLLGIEILIDRPNRHIVYCQKRYVPEVLKRFHMSDCNGCATPEATTPSTAVYLVNASWPDIAHATRHLGKFLATYDHTHYAQAKRVVRYLKATCDYGLVMDVPDGTAANVRCYLDADYANDSVDRRSIRGYVNMLDGNVMSYASRKQEINVLSTCEAKYAAMSEATKYEQSRLITKPGKHSKSKHIDNKYHMVRRNVGLKLLTMQHIATEQMIVDIMTKPLAVVKLTRFRKAMKVLPAVTSDDAMITTEPAASTTTATAAVTPELHLHP